MRTLIIVGVANTLTAAICFRFSRLAYRITLLSVSHDRDQRWLEQVHLAGCDVNLIVCDPHDPSALKKSLQMHRAEPPTILVLMGSSATQQWLMQDGLSPGLPSCERIIFIQNKSEERSCFEKNAVANPSADMTLNTIRIGHIGTSEQYGENTEVDLNPFNDEPPSLDMLSKRSGLPYEVAVLAAFLASDETAHIDGAVIDVHSGRYFS